MNRALILLSLLSAWTLAGANPLLDYYQRDLGREDPRLMLERYATVIEQVSGLSLAELPEVVYASRGDIWNRYLQQSPLVWGDAQQQALAGETALFVGLGLLPKAVEPTATLRESPLATVAGVYVPATKQILLTKSIAADNDAQTLFHELVHAAQDQAIDLQAYRSRRSATLDEVLAGSSLLEGQAQTIELLRLLKTHMPDDAETSLAARLEHSVELHPTPGQGFLRSLSTFPYSAGAVFVLHRYRVGRDRSFAAMLQSPPTTTEQILHPDEASGWTPPARAPLERHAEAVASLLGGEVAYETRIGEALLASFFSRFEPETAAKAAAGWNGDWSAVVQIEDQPPFVVLDTLWDSERDAEEAAAILGTRERAGSEPERPARLRVLRGEARALILVGPEGLMPAAEDALQRLGLTP